jgi:hypothetical protein
LAGHRERELMLPFLFWRLGNEWPIVKMNPTMGAAHKRRLIFQMVRTTCAPVQQLRPKAQIERCEGGAVESEENRTLERRLKE